MSRCKTLGLGSLAAALVATLLTTSSAQAEPYGGFNSVNTRTTYVNYGPRYVQPSQRATYVQQPAQVSYANTTSAYAQPTYAQPVYTQQVYTQPVRQTTTVVQAAPVVEYLQPVAYRGVYTTPAYGYGLGGYGGVSAFGYSGIPVVHARAYYGGSGYGHRSYGRHYSPRSRVYVSRSHHRPYRSFARSHHGRRGRSFGFSIGGGRGGGGFSFRYGR